MQIQPNYAPQTETGRVSASTSGNRPERVGILADEHGLTCSATAVAEYCAEHPELNWTICGFSSFAKLEDALREGLVDLTVIPSAMKDFGRWKFTYKAAGPQGFRASIPAFVAVALVELNGVERTYVLSAMDEFVVPAGYGNTEIVYTESNTDSVVRLLADPDPAHAVAITNTTVALHFGVRVLAELKEPSDMYFEVFGPETFNSVLSKTASRFTAPAA